MRAWLDRFCKNNEDTTLTLNGHTFKRSECKQVGGGSEKFVFKINGTPHAFFIPNKCTSEKVWNEKIKNEKFLLDEIDRLGLKTQRFEIEPIEIKKPGEPTFSIQVLMTKDFESLCKEESIVIYDVKGSPSVIGARPDFMEIKDQLKEKSFAQKMLKKIINEYAIAFTFSLPISILESYLDDSEHFCFELSQNANEPPVVRYMFWDVGADFYGVKRYEPTLPELKSGARNCQSDNPLRGLIHLANKVACAMWALSSTHTGNDWEFVPEVQRDLVSALNDDDFLQQALAQARKLKYDIDNKAACCGLYSFFAKTVVNENTALKELVQLESRFL